MRSSPLSFTVFACVTVLGCTPTTTEIPTHHMSASGEGSLARSDERAAGVLERQAALEDGTIECGPPFANQPGEVCWTTPWGSDAAAEDLMEASELRDAAARHRRISKELREAEARECPGIPEADVTRSPLAHREDIVQVEVVHGAPGPDGQPSILGARVRFHHLGGLTADWLQRIVDCHVARDNALGNNVPEMSYDPLVPAGARATVIEVPHGYIVEVRSDDPAAAREIARRALALRP
jgi:hypothetical protein